MRLGIVLLVAALAGSPSWAEDPRALFEEACAPCHALRPGEESPGPTLAGIGGRRDRAWIERFIADPEGFVASDPEARALAEQFPDLDMPDPELPREDVRALVEFLLAGGATASGEGSPPEPAAAGDPAVGRALFTGAAPFGGGGPACATCHDVEGAPVGGGSLGRPLAKGGVTVRMLLDPPFPTMRPIYRRAPLTSEEAAHVVAFLREPETGEGGLPPVPAAGGVLFVLGLVALAVISRA